jgi:glutamine cyclotransferase
MFFVGQSVSHFFRSLLAGCRGRFNSAKAIHLLFLHSLNPVCMNKLFSVSILFSLIACNGNNNSRNGTHNPPRPPGPAILSYSIINSYPHDTASFTQGLVIYKGVMYEGTGEYGKSKLLQVDLKTGKIERALRLDDKYFGEGITILHDTIYQLTWREGKVFVYTLDFKKVKEFKLDTEGWGITTDGKELIVSNGSSNLYYYHPSGFRLLRTQSITEGGGLAYNLNELEYIDGYIYANQWQAPYILKIDPASGQITGKANLQQVWDRVKAIDPFADVPNGIAYDAGNGKIYVTGKKWPELYEIEFGR